MALFIRLITALSRFLGGFSAALVAASVILMCATVVMRYGLGDPDPWPAGIVTYLMMSLTFLGAPYVMSVRGHVTLVVMQRHAGHRGRVVTSVLAAFLSMIFALLVTWAGVRLLGSAIHEGWRDDSGSGIALWIPYLALPVGGGLLALQCLAEILIRFTEEDSESNEQPIGSQSFPD